MASGFLLALGAGITYFIVVTAIELYGRYLLRKDARIRAKFLLSKED